MFKLFKTRNNKNWEKIMQGLTDVQNAVASLTTIVGQVKSSVATLQAQIVSLQATIAAGGDNDADVEAQAQAINAQVASLNAIVNPASTGT
jgi:hypothetical protein